MTARASITRQGALSWKNAEIPKIFILVSFMDFIGPMRYPWVSFRSIFPKSSITSNFTIKDNPTDRPKVNQLGKVALGVSIIITFEMKCHLSGRFPAMASST